MRNVFAPLRFSVKFARVAKHAELAVWRRREREARRVRQRPGVGAEMVFRRGIAFRADTMYFAEMTAVKRLDPGAAAPVTLVPNLPGGGHITRTLVIGPDNAMYVAVGSSCNVCDDAPPRAAVTRYSLKGWRWDDQTQAAQPRHAGEQQAE